MQELTVVDFLKSMFMEGDIFIVERTDCVSKEISYEVQSGMNEILFEVTKKWFDSIHSVHKREWVHLTPCGCICRVVIPNGVDFDPRQMMALLN